MYMYHYFFEVFRHQLCVEHLAVSKIIGCLQSLLLWPVQNTVLLDAATVLAFGLVTDPYFAPKSTNWWTEPDRILR